MCEKKRMESRMTFKIGDKVTSNAALMALASGCVLMSHHGQSFWKFDQKSGRIGIGTKANAKEFYYSDVPDLTEEFTIKVISDTPPPQRAKTVLLENITDLLQGDLETQAMYLHEIANNDGLEAFKIALKDIIKGEVDAVQSIKGGHMAGYGVDDPIYYDEERCIYPNGLIFKLGEKGNCVHWYREKPYLPHEQDDLKHHFELKMIGNNHEPNPNYKGDE